MLGTYIMLQNIPLVSILMITYNHEAYIAEAIKSIINQKTSFNFELVIGEDCSTDNTLSIIQQYANKFSNIIKLVTSQHNVGMYENIRRVINLSIGRYFAFCEGDDLWNDRSKLQKQVEFLEKYSDYSMVYAGIDVWQEKQGLISKYNGKKLPEGYIYDKLFYFNMISTCSVCCRSELYKRAFSLVEPAWKMIDYPCWLYIAKHSRIKFFSESLATYRILNESASHSKSIQKMIMFNKSCLAIRTILSNKFGTIHSDHCIKLIYCMAMHGYCIKSNKWRYINIYFRYCLFLYNKTSEHKIIFRIIIIQIIAYFTNSSLTLTKLFAKLYLGSNKLLELYNQCRSKRAAPIGEKPIR